LGPEKGGVGGAARSLLTLEEKEEGGLQGLLCNFWERGGGGDREN